MVIQHNSKFLNKAWYKLYSTLPARTSSAYRFLKLIQTNNSLPPHKDGSLAFKTVFLFAHLIIMLKSFLCLYNSALQYKNYLWFNSHVLFKTQPKVGAGDIHSSQLHGS